MSDVRIGIGDELGELGERIVGGERGRRLAGGRGPDTEDACGGGPDVGIARGEKLLQQVGLRKVEGLIHPQRLQAGAFSFLLLRPGVQVFLDFVRTPLDEDAPGAFDFVVVG